MRVVELVVACVLASGCTHYAASAVSDTSLDPMGMCRVDDQCSVGGGNHNLPLAVAVGSAVAGLLTYALISRIAGDW